MARSFCLIKLRVKGLAMKTTKRIMIQIMLLLFTALSVYAAPVKIYLPEFKITGAPNGDEMKTTLAGLLSSRLAGGAAQSLKA